MKVVTMQLPKLTCDQHSMAAYPVRLGEVINSCALCKELRVAQNLKVHLWVAICTQDLHNNVARRHKVCASWVGRSHHNTIWLYPKYCC